MSQISKRLECSASRMRLHSPATGFLWTLAALSMASVSPCLVLGQGNSTLPAPIERVGGDVKAPTLIHGGDSNTGELKRLGRNGICYVSLIVSTAGVPEDVHVLRCSEDVFAQPSLDSVTQSRYKPATKHGQPVAVRIVYTSEYHLGFGAAGVNFCAGEKDSASRLHYSFGSPPGANLAVAEDQGAVPLVGGVVAPSFTKFSDQGFCKAAVFEGGLADCDFLLTVLPTGKPSGVSLLHCNVPGTEKVALESLLQSHFSPGTSNGSTVPVRVALQLKYEDH